MPRTIGVLGGGQLARMLCEAAGPLGIPVAVLDQPGCPAMQCNPSALNVFGSFKDAARIRELARRVDVLTVETEHVNVDVLEEIATVGVDVPTLAGEKKKTKKIVPVHPSWRTLRLIQNKFDQKEHFFKHGIPIAPQMALSEGAGGDALEESMQMAASNFGFPFMVKAKRDSYDGRGNFKVAGQADFARAAEALGARALYAEQWVPFVAELSVMVIRTEDDDGKLTGVYSYPVVETVHEDSICSLVFMPPRTTSGGGGAVTPETCAAARRLAEKTASSLWGRGVFAVEMFVQHDGTLTVNEVAPRPHNSGHLTIESTPYMSQFKAQLYSVLDMIPPRRENEGNFLVPRVKQAVMVNIIGGAHASSHLPLVELAGSDVFLGTSVDAYLHMYGKEARPNRKIGHVTVTSATESQETLPLAAAAATLIDTAAAIRRDRLAADTSSSSSPSLVSPPPLVTVTMGSDSDMPVLKAGLDVLARFGVPFEVRITSAHRTPLLMMRLGQEAAARGVRVMIAAAGGAAHLPGMLASETPLPVIGVPVKASQLDGVDSLLSIVQMPRGIPTATVGINNSTNAALLAIRILGSYDPLYLSKMETYMRDMATEVEGKAAELERIGYADYLGTRLGK